MSLEVNPQAVVVEKFEKSLSACKSKEEVKLGARKTAEYFNNTIKLVTALNDRTEEMIKAALLLKEIDEIDCLENPLV